VIVSGFFLANISIHRDCRQGNPIVPCLFLLSAEILSIRVKSNKNIKGICVGQTEQKVSQYADNTNFMLDDTYKYNSFYAPLDIFEVFTRMSGLKINTDKGQDVWT